MLVSPAPMTRFRTACALVVAALVAGTDLRSEGTLPNKPDSLKFAVIGDNGTGDEPQDELGAEMHRVRDRFPFTLVLMLGDNFYGRQRPDDLRQKFDRPYAPLLAADKGLQRTGHGVRGRGRRAGCEDLTCHGGQLDRSRLDVGQGQTPAEVARQLR